jgi:hypothetical protein
MSTAGLRSVGRGAPAFRNLITLHGMRALLIGIDCMPPAAVWKCRRVVRGCGAGLRVHWPRVSVPMSSPTATPCRGYPAWWSPRPESDHGPSRQPAAVPRQHNLAEDIFISTSTGSLLTVSTASPHATGGPLDGCAKTTTGEGRPPTGLPSPRRRTNPSDPAGYQPRREHHQRRQPTH